MKKILDQSFAVPVVLAAALALAPFTARADSPAALAPLPTLAPLIESVKGSVVSVDVQSRVNRVALGELDDMFNLPRRRRGEREPLAQGKGSGVIVEGRGLVLTNNHVVQDAVLIRVNLEDGRSFDAETVGRDPATDLALIRLKGKLDNLPMARLGDSEALRVGDWVFAIGNPFGLSSSVTLGTRPEANPVPARDRGRDRPRDEGSKQRVGLSLQDLDSDLAEQLGVDPQGALVADVVPGSAAERAKLARGMVIVEADRRQVRTSSELTKLIKGKRSGEVLLLRVVVPGGQGNTLLRAITMPRAPRAGPMPRRRWRPWSRRAAGGRAGPPSPACRR